jgi:hypothetical protein
MLTSASCQSPAREELYIIRFFLMMMFIDSWAVGVPSWWLDEHVFEGQ